MKSSKWRQLAVLMGLAATSEESYRSARGRIEDSEAAPEKKHRRRGVSTRARTRQRTRREMARASRRRNLWR